VVSQSNVSVKKGKKPRQLVIKTKQTFLYFIKSKHKKNKVETNSEYLVKKRKEY
jgi:hypothetical protein